MKLTLFMNVLLISTLSILAVGCGKDKKKSKSDNLYYNPYFGGSTGGQAVNSLNSYLAAQETLPLPFSVAAVPVVYKLQTGDGCSTVLKIFQFCNSWNTDVDYENAIVNITPNLVRSSYPGISQAMNPVAPAYLVGVYQTGTSYDVYHALSGSNKLIRYTISTTVHAGLNPVRIEDSNAETLKELYKIGF